MGGDRPAGMKWNLWEGDRHFLPLVFDRNTRPFHVVMQLPRWGAC